MIWLMKKELKSCLLEQQNQNHVLQATSSYFKLLDQLTLPWRPLEDLGGMFKLIHMKVFVPEGKRFVNFCIEFNIKYSET